MLLQQFCMFIPVYLSSKLSTKEHFKTGTPTVEISNKVLQLPGSQSRQSLYIKHKNILIDTVSF